MYTYATISELFLGTDPEPVYSMHWELFHDFRKQVLTLQPLKNAFTVCGYV